MLSVSENLQTDPTRWRSETSEPPDPRDSFTFWTPSPESDHAVEMLERLPGLARAIEVWERDLCAGDDEEIRHDGRSLFQIHSSSALDALDGDDPPWHGPDPLYDWVSDREDWP